MNKSVFFDFSIDEIITGFKSGKFTAREISEASINNINNLEERYKAWVCFSSDLLLAQAEVAEKNIKNGQLRELEGVPVGIKDIFNTVNFPTQMGSPLWKDFTPGNDARAVFNLKRAGALIPGKTVTAEFAVHTLDKTLNPHNILKTPGTSSSGSAVAVALGMVPAAIGTQTAGSIVRPASFCGIYGCKPSFGTIPRTGSLKTTDSLDTIGFFTNFNSDLRTLFDALRVHGQNDPISDSALSDSTRQNKAEDRPWRVVFAKTHTWENAPLYAREAAEEFIKKLSQIKDVEIVDVKLPEILDKAHEIHEKIYNKSLSYYFKNEFEKAEFVSPIMNELISLGNETKISDYHAALEDQSKLISEMDDFMENYDIIISLSTAGEAPDRNELELPDPALIWTLAQLPVVSAPVFTSPEKLPYGLQIVARKYNDYLLFNFIEYLTGLKILPEGSNPSLRNILDKK